ncbi:MAG: DUF2007 domain-containing protein [Rhodobacteraceae bacterium]|nr:DUF2007 domain-containing protein [Paracoccaceae bacterium]
MKELLRANDPTVIAFAEALLQGEEIDCFVFDMHMNVLEGNIGIFPKRLLVREQDYESALDVLVANDLDPSTGSAG